MMKDAELTTYIDRRVIHTLIDGHMGYGYLRKWEDTLGIHYALESVENGKLVKTDVDRAMIRKMEFDPKFQADADYKEFVDNVVAKVGERTREIVIDRKPNYTRFSRDVHKTTATLHPGSFNDGKHIIGSAILKLSPGFAFPTANPNTRVHGTGQTFLTRMPNDDDVNLCVSTIFEALGLGHLNK
jgi:hypothetical protein